MSLPKDIWENEYQTQRADFEDDYFMLIDEWGQMALQFEAACVVERMRAAATVPAVPGSPGLTLAPGGAGAGERGVPAVAASIAWQAERELAAANVVRLQGEQEKEMSTATTPAGGVGTNGGILSGATVLAVHDRDAVYSQT